MRDLSHSITDGMQVYPGDPEVHLRAALVIDPDGAEVTEVRMGSHTGTHIDAPSHTIPGGRTMADVSLDELVGEALVVRLAGLDDEVVDIERMSRAQTLPDVLPPIVILDTGWARWFGSDRALRHPALDPAAARVLVDRGMHVLAVDTLSPDPTGPSGATEFPVHEIVLRADHLIVENLTGLDALADRARIGFFPLRLQGDGAPVRAVAFD